MYRKQYKDKAEETLQISVAAERDDDHYEQPSYSEELKPPISPNETDDLNNNNLVTEEPLGATNYKKSFQRRKSDYIAKRKKEIENQEKRQRSSSLNDPLAPFPYDSHNSVIIDHVEAEDFISSDSQDYPQSHFINENLSVEHDHHQLVNAGPIVIEDSVESQRARRESRLRRSSSLSSIPAYFYPDPYSIVVSRYLEDLGSLSSYSPASGSEATEYLQISPQLGTPEITETSGGAESFIHGNMNFDSALSTSEEYQSFRSSVPLRKICVEADGSKEWKVYDAGPRSVRTPLLCLGPACSTSDVFYKQILNLTARGLRVISVEGPVYWSVEDWCKGLKKLLDCLNLDKVHIFGASLGGFLAQKFAEYTYQYSRVASLILCNTFLDTSIFDYHDSAMIFWMLPSVILKKLIIENITAARIMDLDIAHAIEFMIERLNNLSQQELASRMTLNCVNCHVDTFKLKQIKMTLMDVFDESALSNQAREDLYRNYTDAKLAHLKSGGNFPYLSRSDDVSMHIMVHLRAFSGTKHSAQLEESPVGSSSSSAITVHSTSQKHGSNLHHKNAEDVLGSTGPPSSLPTGSLEDKNKAFKEQAASVLGLPVQ